MRANGFENTTSAFKNFLIPSSRPKVEAPPPESTTLSIDSMLLSVFEFAKNSRVLFIRFFC